MIYIAHAQTVHLVLKVYFLSRRVGACVWRAQTRILLVFYTKQIMGQCHRVDNRPINHEDLLSRCSTLGVPIVSGQLIIPTSLNNTAHSEPTEIEISLCIYVYIYVYSEYRIHMISD